METENQVIENRRAAVAGQNSVEEQSEQGNRSDLGLYLLTFLLFSWSFALDYKYVDVPQLITEYMRRLMGFVLAVYVFDLVLSMPLRLFRVDRRKVSILRIVCLLLLVAILGQAYRAYHI